MPALYNFTLSDGVTTIPTIYALESNGFGNTSIPKQILDINFDISNPYIVVDDDVTLRFVNGFSFNIVGGSPYDGTYAVSGAPTTETLANGKIVTRIPLATPLTVAGFDIVGASTGLGGSWIITGTPNGSTLFYPTSVFSITGNSLPAANGNYTVTSAVTGNNFTVSSIVTGANNGFMIAGDVTKFFIPASTIKVYDTNSNNVVYTYTIVAATLVTGNTKVEVVETISTEIIVSPNTMIQLNSPNTVITVSEDVPTGSGLDGTAVPAAPVSLSFVGLSPIVITPTTAHNYLVTFRLEGDQSGKLLADMPFYVRGLLYNNVPYTSAFTVQTSTYDNVSKTNVVVAIVDDSATMPVLTLTDTPAKQYINLSSITDGSDVTGLANDATIYTATITIDSIDYNITTFGVAAQTLTQLIYEINLDLAGAGIATIDATNDRIVISSTTTGSASSISVVDGTLFSTLTNFADISAAVAGTSNSWVLFPMPALPYGHVQYSVAPVSTSLELVGPGCPSYNDTTSWGKAFQSNLIHSLENFKHTSPPVAPLDGQLWFNPSVPSMSVYHSAGWNEIVSTVWPVQDYIDMNNHPIVRLTDAVTTYPYVASTTGFGNNDQEAMNLRTSDSLYIAKTGGSDASASVRSGTMTGSLNMNGASPVGASTIGINVNSAPVSMYGTSNLDFKDASSGSIVFEATSTGNINILGSGNVTITNGNLTVGSGTDQVVIQNNVGAAPTMTFTTATTNNAVINLSNNKIVNLISPTNALDAANKAYVDSLVNGIIWIQPVKDPNLFDDSLTVPPTIAPGDTLTPYHKTYIVATGGTGDWAGLDGHVVTYNPQSASWVDILGRAVQVGDRFGVFCEPDDNDPLSSLPAGGLTGKAGKIVTIASLGPIVYTDYVPVEPDAFGVTGSNPTVNVLTNSIDRSPHFGHTYTFRGVWGTGTFGADYAWIEISGPQMLVDGAGLSYTGNILNIGAAFGITVNSNDIQVNQTDLNTIYVRRDGTTNMSASLDMNTHSIINVVDPTNPQDAATKNYTDTTFVKLAGSAMNLNANITFSGTGEVLGLPAIPTVGGAAASKTYVDTQDGLRLALAGGTMNLLANITLNGGEILGLPSVPSIGDAAVSKTYLDNQLSAVATDTTVVHLAGTETITGAKTFNAAVNINAATTIAAQLNITTGANIVLSGGSGELTGLPAIPTLSTSATSKAYVDNIIVPLAVNSTVVHLAGIETITGAKTLSGATTISNTLDVLANGVFNNLAISTTGLAITGTTVTGGGGYTVSSTAGANTGGTGGNNSLIGGAGSTTGGNVIVSGGAGTTVAGGNVQITSGTGPTTINNGSITLTAGNAALLLDPQGVWRINNVAPSSANQAIVSNTATPTTGVPSWKTVAHLVAAAPATSADPGNPGDYFADDNFLYTYGATGWRRVAVSSF